jgi:DNA-binding transcriptional MocR family regulator
VARDIKYDHHVLNWSDVFAFFHKTNRFYLYRDRKREAMSLFSQENVISFGTGLPDPKYYPIENFQKVIKKIFKEHGKTVLQIAPVEGCYPLRKALADWITQDGEPASPEEILITSGANQSLYLVAEILVNPGDLVVVENPTSMNSLRIFCAAEATIIDIPADEQGMRVDILESLLSRQKVKLIYTVPTFQNPSGAVLSLDRRTKLLDLAYRCHVPIIEDDPYSELYYERVPPPSLRALDRHDTVIHLGTFSKILFPGLRTGWVTAPRQVIEQLTSAKQLIDLHNNTLAQYAFYEFYASGLMEKHLQKIRKLYAKKRDLLLSALSKCCSSSMTWNSPEGGFFLWCRLNEGLNSQDLLKEAIFEKVTFMEGRAFSPKDDRGEWLRLNFTYLDEDLIEEGVNRLNRAIKKLRKMGMIEKAGSSPLNPII